MKKIIKKDLSYQQLQGGKLTIPDNYFVHGANFDVEQPYIFISNEEKPLTQIRLLIPPALAYYLRTHHCGSDTMRKNIYDSGAQSVRDKIKEAIGIE